MPVNVICKWLFTENVHSFVPYVTHLFQTSLKHGVVRLAWKEVYICPIYKGGKRSSPSNYILGSLTIILSKLMKHIVCTSMWKHIEQNNLMTNCQHGFRRKYNTTRHILHATYKA